MILTADVRAGARRQLDALSPQCQRVSPPPGVVVTRAQAKIHSILYSAPSTPARLCVYVSLSASPAHLVCIGISMHNAQKMAKWKTLFCCRWHFAFSIALKKEMCLISIQSNFDNAAANTNNTLTHTHTQKSCCHLSLCNCTNKQHTLMHTHTHTRCFQASAAAFVVRAKEK